MFSYIVLRVGVYVVMEPSIHSTLHLRALLFYVLVAKSNGLADVIPPTVSIFFILHPFLVVIYLKQNQQSKLQICKLTLSKIAACQWQATNFTRNVRHIFEALLFFW